MRGTNPHDRPGITLRETVTAPDIAAVRALVRATGFFSDEEIEIAAELAGEGAAHGPASGYEFLLALHEDGLAGYTCYGRTPGTKEAFDLYWIVVSPDAQRQGLGRLLIEETAARIRQRGGGRVYAETSARAQYAPTREFYLANGFRQEALLPDFYAPGEGKLIYCLVL